MTIQPYFTLTDSLGTSKKFRCMLAGYKPSVEKSQDVRKTIGGGIDVAMGQTYVTYNYMLRVRMEDELEGEGYGNLADLEYFYSLANFNPGLGEASNVLTYQDFDDTKSTQQVLIVGKLERESLAAVAHGPYSLYIVPLTLLVIPEPL